MHVDDLHAAGRQYAQAVGDGREDNRTDGHLTAAAFHRDVNRGNNNSPDRKRGTGACAARKVKASLSVYRNDDRVQHPLCCAGTGRRDMYRPPV